MIRPPVFEYATLVWPRLWFLTYIELIRCAVGVCNFGVEDLKRALATVRYLADIYV
jgi:diketogulonate reductase-like aldo/keto reductase